MGEPWISSLGQDQQCAGLLPEQKQIGYAPSQGSCPGAPPAPVSNAGRTEQPQPPKCGVPLWEHCRVLHKASHFILPGT